MLVIPTIIITCVFLNAVACTNTGFIRCIFYTLSRVSVIYNWFYNNIIYFLHAVACVGDQ